ncbi:sensor histidine kinase [Ructibacterium gallinarum]|uniref:histidine kinase n=1 Tax=Ructibacterium gallinarum TaxID=2779355 RepID=A0A9D5M1D3_9FIRM|nr:sensor histidine kinase [Ructibacterium gallinarum]MBE5040341.1 sensor histidine kinase [Ructibacterium gallinarum]
MSHMNQVKRFLKSTFFRFMAAFLVVAVFPMILFSALIINYFAENHRRVILQNYQSSLAGMADKMDTTYLDAVNILHEIDAQYLFSSDAPAMLRYYLNKNSNLENIIFVAPDGVWELESKENKYKNVFFDFQDAEWFEAMREKGEDVVITHLHDQPYFNGVNDYVISIVKNYYDHSGEYAGMIILDLNINYFLDLYRSSGMSDVEKLEVVDQNNICIYSTSVYEIGGDFVPENLNRLNAEPTDAAVNDLGDAFYLVAKSENMGNTLFLQLNNRRIFADLYNMQKYLLILGIFAVMVIVCLSVYFAFSMSEPLKAVLQKLQKIKAGNFDLEKTPCRDDEIGIISSGVDDMIRDLKAYIDKEYFYQLKQKQTELKALKMQIKPHYIYNTLEIIRVTAKEEKAGKTAVMISALAEQLRYLLDTGSEFASLEDELNNVKRYIELMQFRFENSVDINIDYQVDEQALSYRVPKIILQPIVENIFKHAISETTTHLLIAIHVTCTENGIEAAVFDNGRGMDGQVAAAVLSQDSSENVHIGLKSVDERIKLLYGNEYGLMIQSETGMGTLVKILLPKSE